MADGPCFEFKQTSRPTLYDGKQWPPSPYVYRHTEGTWHFEENQLVQVKGGFKMTNNSPKTFILLLDGGSASRGRVRRWLTDRGFITWEAKDVCHAIEEVSDFTVKRRPDVVLLEVPAIPECFDSFKSTFQVSPNELSIVALSESPSAKSKPFVASSLNQLSMYMDNCPAPV
jgi:hypothetical protein